MGPVPTGLPFLRAVYVENGNDPEPVACLQFFVSVTTIMGDYNDYMHATAGNISLGGFYRHNGIPSLRFASLLSYAVLYHNKALRLFVKLRRLCFAQFLRCCALYNCWPIHNLVWASSAKFLSGVLCVDFHVVFSTRQKRHNMLM